MKTICETCGKEVEIVAEEDVSIAQAIAGAVGCEPEELGFECEECICNEKGATA